jgi:hypothetical protein
MKHKIITYWTAALLLIAQLTPLSVYAQGIPTFDVGLNSYGQGGVMGTVKEYGLDTLAYTLSKLAGAKIANKVFNKANGGASGDSAQPSYIKNFNSYFSDLSNLQVDRFVTDLGLSKNPFAGPISQSIIQSVQSGARLKNSIDGFNLDQVIGSNWQDFATNADVGGWDGILALSNPANTGIGSALIAKEDLARTIQNAKDLEQLKLTSSGTKPQGKCTLDFMDYKNRTEAIMQGRDDLQFGNDAFSTGATFTNPDGTTATDQQAIDQLNNLQGQNVQNAQGLAEDYGQCLGELIQNPVGTVIGGINKQLDTVSDGFSQGDEIGEILVGMLMNMVISFVQSGLSSLSADFNANRGNVGGPEELINKNGQAIQWTSTPNTIIDLSVEFSPALTSTKKEVDDLKRYIELVSDTGNGESFASVITDLDQCTPGPDYGYKKRLDTYITKQTKRLDKRKDKGSDSKQNRKNNALDNIDASIDSAKVYASLAFTDTTRNIPGADSMLAQVNSITKIQSDYQDVKSELAKKQVALSLLNSIKNGLQANMQYLKQSALPGIPDAVAFSNEDWNTLTAAQKTTALNWAKTVSKIPTTFPLTTDDWNTLTAAQKTTALNWAKVIQDKPTGTSDKDFVLATIWVFMGIPTNTPESSIKQMFVVKTMWKVWSNPENYMATPWDTESDVAKAFLAEKNKLRTSFNNLQNDVSNTYSVTKAKKNIDQLTSIVKTAGELRDDCETLRTIVSQNRFTGPDAHAQLKTVLVNNIARFKSDDIKNAIRNPANSILGQVPLQTYTEVGTKYSLSCDPGRCFDGSDVIAPIDRDPDDDSAPDETAIKSYTEFQIQPAKDIWEILDQRNAAFCGFNVFLKLYPNALPNPVLDGGKPIECSDEWMHVEKTDIRGIIFGGFSAEDL